jgi:hypothetical protein
MQPRPPPPPDVTGPYAIAHVGCSSTCHFRREATGLAHPPSRGFSSNGRLGDGTTTTSSGPVKVALQLYTATTSRRKTAWCGPPGRHPHLGDATGRASLLLGHAIRIGSRESALPMGGSPRLGPDPPWLAAFLSSPNWRPRLVGGGDQDFVRQSPPWSNGGQPCSEDRPLP